MSATKISNFANYFNFMETSQQGNGLIITSVISYHQQLIEIKI